MYYSAMSVQHFLYNVNDTKHLKLDDRSQMKLATNLFDHETCKNNTFKNCKSYAGIDDCFSIDTDLNQCATS